VSTAEANDKYLARLEEKLGALVNESILEAEYTQRQPISPVIISTVPPESKFNGNKDKDK